MDLDYSDAVRRRFHAPTGAGRPAFDPHLTGRAGSVETGLEMTFYLGLDGDGTIEQAAFTAFGCPHAIAVGAWFCERLPGQVLNDAVAVELESVVAALDLPAPKWRCVLVAQDALTACRAAAG